MDPLQLPQQQSFDNSVDMSFEQGDTVAMESGEHVDNEEPLEVKPFYQGGPRAVHQCNVCNKIFVSFKGLQQHAIIHTDMRPHSCEVCEKSFRFKSNLFEHKSVHSGFALHECPFCGKTCRLKGNLKKHIRTHVSTDEELEEAWKPFASNRRPPAEVPADAVILRSNGESPYGLTPIRPRRMSLGLRKTEGIWIQRIRRGQILPTGSIEEKLECFRSALNALVSNNAAFKTLLNKAQMASFENFVCPVCNANFTSRGECSEHLDLEHPLARVERPLFCEICLKSFDDQKAMEQHESYHKRVHLLVEHGDLVLTDPEPLIPNINDLPAIVSEDGTKEESSDQIQNPLNSHDSSQANGQTQNSVSLPNQHDSSDNNTCDVKQEQIPMDQQLQASDSLYSIQENSYQAEDGQLF